MKKTTILKAGIAPFALGLALAASPAAAQVTTGATDEDDVTADADGTDSQPGAIVVTGSRIARPNLESPSPVTVVGAEQVELTGTTTVETLLNELPQVIPGNTRVSNNSGGENFSTIDLRGLGPGRTLILLDGERLPASTTTGVTDVAQIPTGLIERIEVVTGGASAVYGSDALAGVVNFILKDDYEGVEMTGQYSISEDGTGGQYTIAGLMGGNFADGRGNFTFYGSWTDRDSVFQGEYDYSAISAAIYLPINPDTGQYGIPYVADSPSDIPDDGNIQALISSGGSATPPWGWIANSATNPWSAAALPADNNPNCNPTGTAVSFDDAGNLTRRYASGDCAIPIRSIGSSRYNYGPINYLVTPYDRLTLTAKGRYDFSADTRMKLYFSYTNANQQVALAPTPATDIVVPADSPEIPADLAALLATRPDPDAPFLINRRFFETGARIGDFTTDAKTLRAIVEHDFSNDWAMNVVGSFGRVDNKIIAQGNIRRSAVEQGLAGCPANSGPGCVNVDIFGPNTLTPDMLSFVALTTTDTESFEQLRLATNLTGSLMELPGGPLGIAIGAEYRKDTGNTQVDDAKRTGDIIGFNAQGSISGSINVKEVYGEFRAPILDFVSVGAGARYSDYSTAGGLFNWKAEAEIEPTYWIKARASYNRAARAPNVFELFRNGDQGFPSFSDPCSATTTGAGTATPNQALIDQCVATGVPLAAIPTFAAVNSQVQATAFGNQNLSEEKAETWTAGIVLTPGNLLGADVTLTADYYNIRLTNRVAGLGAGFFISQCYFANNADACSRITRNTGTGQISNVDTTVTNSNSPLETAGVDVGLDIKFDGFGGEIFISDVLTYVEKYDIIDGDTGAVTELVDTAFPGIGGVTPQWKNALTAGWRNEDFTAQVRYVWARGAKQNFPGAFLDGLYPYDLDTGDSLYDEYPDRIDDLALVNMSFRWRAAENFELTAIVNNVLDKYPPQTTTGIFEQANTNISFYDGYALGRNWTLQARVKF